MVPDIFGALIFVSARVESDVCLKQAGRVCGLRLQDVVCAAYLETGFWVYLRYLGISLVVFFMHVANGYFRTDLPTAHARVSCVSTLVYFNESVVPRCSQYAMPFFWAW